MINAVRPSPGNEARAVSPSVDPVPLTGSAPWRALGNLKLVRVFLGLPLGTKLAGAHAIIVVVAFAIAFAISPDGEALLLTIVASALGISLIVSEVLVTVALRPLRDLHRTTVSIGDGDLGARVPASILADAEFRRVASAFNALLDSLMEDRARIRALAAEVISAGDRERARIALELHDSTAQMLAALLAELSVLARDNTNPESAERLEHIRGITAEVLEDVRLLARGVYPRVLDDLGLPAALRFLSREATAQDGAAIKLDIDAGCDVGSAAGRSVLYRVAQESIHNALRHADATTVVLRLKSDGDVALLEIEDDGRGFDLADAERRRRGMGLLTMRERAGLVGGTVTIDSAVGRGTRVRAAVPRSPALDGIGRWMPNEQPVE